MAIQVMGCTVLPINVMASSPNTGITRMSDKLPISGTELLGRLNHDEQVDLAEGEASVNHLKRADVEVVACWLQIGAASVTLRNAAMRIAGTNQPHGKGYNLIWGALADTKPGLRDLERRDRAHAMWLADNWTAVDRWLATLGDTERGKLHHPTSIMRRYQAKHPPMTANGEAAPQLGLQDKLIKAMAENALLKRGRIAAPHTVVVEVLRESYGADTLRKMAKLLGEAADADERQDAIEAKVKRRRA